jgi:hypothetical protein
MERLKISKPDARVVAEIARHRARILKQVQQAFDRGDLVTLLELLRPLINREKKETVN